MSVTLSAFSNEIADLVEKTAASVVAVHARMRFNSSGVHWAPGLIVTADHTVRADEEVTLSHGRDKLTADVVGRDPGTDIAVLRVRGTTSLPVAPRLDSPVYRPGALVVAVGRNTESPNADLGVISSVGGPTQSRRGGRLDAVVRLNLDLHPVSSGAGVVDADGNLLGIATPALSRVAVFAIPNQTIDRVVNAVLQHGGVPQGYLGAGLQPVALPAHLIKSKDLKSPTGLMTISVDNDSPAGHAGLIIGDVLLECNGISLTRPETLRPLLSEAVGRTIDLRILRGGEIRNLTVAITQRKSR